MEDISKVYEFYNGGAEVGRLERGLGVIELYRSKEIISQYLPDGKLTVCDIGGGVGRYSEWLAEKGHDVTMIELAPSAVELAIKEMKSHYTAKVGDARELDMPSECADVVLLMGPLYHLMNRDDRMKVISEAYRILRPDGILIAAGISKYSSATWALSVYGNGVDFIDDDVYMDMLKREMSTGEHIRPATYPRIIADAYFHTPGELEEELKEGGFETCGKHAVEGCLWITPELNAKWEDPVRRARLLEIIHASEKDETMMGISPHFLVIGRKK
jgi:ubiquinone/menaquinone biosynthesis C-methylase UbiE